MTVVIVRYAILISLAELAALLLLSLSASLNIEIFSITTYLNFAITATMVALLPVFLIAVFLTVLEWRNTFYTLESGEYRVVEDFVDQRHGKFIINRGGLFHREDMYPANLFVHTELKQFLLGRIFGYAHVRLVPGPKQNISPVYIRYINKPEKLIHHAQQLIDTANGIDNQMGT